MVTINVVGAVVIAHLALYAFFRAAESNWPSAYFSLASGGDYSLTLDPVRYCIFRFGPVASVMLFVAVTLDRWGDRAAVAVHLTAALHVATTSARGLRGIWREWKSRGTFNGALCLLHLLVGLMVAATGFLTLIVYRSLEGLIPPTADIAGNLWGAIAAAVLAVYLNNVARDREETRNSFVERSTRRISSALWREAEGACRAAQCDVRLLSAVLILENAQRPSWFRRLERVKAVIIPDGTYGIAQIRSPHPISDEESIRLAAATLAGFGVPPEDYTERSVWFKKVGKAYNGNPHYGSELESIYDSVPTEDAIASRD